ncbi:alpha-mannosidase [Gaoshiqia sediminis]|uniref:Alpha-mannosidase n=1 Tax=Gaoshiqia sediminis TaxID=2986998 RepID=A0AA41YAD9_9BACT|nr:glycoside hydrolase family 38 C-terminal domain-containing protein [Gaoshiqia sediminis]MCW0483928.1 alpha-mannosidase [Gaoshiqia sediminis]
MKIESLLLSVLLMPLSVFAQPLEMQQKFDLKKDRVLYTIGYSHLDTEWRWDYTASIDEYIKNTMDENFLLFEKYPEYVFNFTGSRRYKMMKEYYPEKYQKVKEYIEKGRWHISGSSVEEGEVNASSSESIIRQVLYGNDFFRKEFGKESYDYMLPDCFGFIGSVPSAWHHCGLLGFSTQKLKSGAAIDLPFNVGVWNGPDGKGIIASLIGTSYTRGVEEDLNKSDLFNERIESNLKKSGYAFDYVYYGIGDKGGAPRENDVRNAVRNANSSDGKFKVVLTSTDQMFKDISPEIRESLPEYSGDLLLTQHSAGSLTSQAFLKRMNRKNENLAQSAEQMASVASSLMKTEYPQSKLNCSWELVLGSQMHDILPGTAIPSANELAYNDEFIAENGFSETLKNALSTISSQLNTQVEGRAVIVYNPVAADRDDIVTAELEYSTLPHNIKVFDTNGEEVPSQVLSKNGNKLKFIFLAEVPSMGLAVFDVQEANAIREENTKLTVTSNSVENEYYNIKVNENGDIASIYDKKLKKELLLRPARLEFLYEKPNSAPAWNMTWENRQNPPIDYFDEVAEIKVLENGPVRVALKVIRNKRNTEIAQIISLGTGSAGKRVEINNQIDWQSTSVSLKASFPLVAENENATYNMGVGTIQRNTNHSRKFEVPTRQWFDLTDKTGDFGISILEDCKYGSDKPDKNTLRLTLLYTPGINDIRYFHQGTQDFGIHDIKYGIYSHKGNWNESETPKQAEFFNKPLVAFEAPKHQGKLGKSVSFLEFNDSSVGMMAFKKAENSDYYILRVNELFGKDQKNIEALFQANIVDAYEVNGQEQRIGDVHFSENRIRFDLSHYTIGSYAIKFAPGSSFKDVQSVVQLPYNEDVMSFDRNRFDGVMSEVRGEVEFDRVSNVKKSYPAELVPDAILSEGIRFRMGSKEDMQNNVVSCKGQIIELPAGSYNKLYILAAATGDVTDYFSIGEKKVALNIQNWLGFIGQPYTRILSADEKEVLAVNDPFVKNSNIAWFASHHHNHYPSKNVAYQYSHIYKYEIDLPEGSTELTLPENEKIKVFAVTVAQKEADDIKLLHSLTDNFKDNKKFVLR